MTEDTTDTETSTDRETTRTDSETTSIDGETTSTDSDGSDDAETEPVIRNAEGTDAEGTDADDTAEEESVGTEPDSRGPRGESDAPRRGESRRRRDRNGGTWQNAGLRERLQWVALVVLVLVAISTLFLFYTNVSRLISIWASRRYAPAFQAAFALAVLASALAGITWLSRDLY